MSPLNTSINSARSSRISHHSIPFTILVEPTSLFNFKNGTASSSYNSWILAPAWQLYTDRTLLTRVVHGITHAHKQVAWDRAMRFEAVDGRILCGEPLDADSDIGLASFAGQKIEVHVLSGASLLNLDTARTGEVAVVKRILSPLSQAEVGTIRCIGLNVRGGLSYSIIFDHVRS